MALQIILIVDDNPLDQELISRKLNNLHAELSTGDNLEAAYKLAKEINPSIVLLDIKIPVRYGGPPASLDQLLEFVRFQREKSCIVVITGDENQPNVDQFYEAGAMDYIGKEKISIDSELVNRVRDAWKTYTDFIDKKETARMALNLAILRSNMEKMIFMMRKWENHNSATRDKDDRRKFEQAFSAGRIAGIKEQEAKFWKKTGIITAGFASGLWAIYNFFGGFIKGLLSHH